MLPSHTPSAEDLSRLRHTFEPHDPRETFSRFHLPVPRQVWLLGADGKSAVNSADSEKRGMPPYLLIMDLVFAATSSNCADLILGGDPDHLDLAESVGRFFMLLLAVMWVWMSVNRELNAFDPEDISFELIITALMAGMMGITFSLKSCFLARDHEDGLTGCWNASFPALASECAGTDADGAACRQLASLANATGRCFALGRDDHLSLVPSRDADGRAANSCFDFLAAWAAVRLLLVLLYLYIAASVRHVRRVKRSNAAASLACWAALFGLMFPLCAYSVAGEAPPHPRMLERLLLLATLLDMGLHFGPHGLCATNAVPQSIAYTETRYERMLIITIGNVIANCARQMSGSRDALTPGAAASIWFGVPLISLLLRIYYFDLSPHYGGAATATHAMRVSRERAVAYTLVHLPLFGSVLWISRAVAFMVVRDGRTSLELLRSAHETDTVTKVGCSVDAASFCAALVCYVLCVTVLQMLHRGQGRGRRNLGKTKRLGLRMLFLVGLVGLTAFAISSAMDTYSYFWLVLMLMATEAGIELWGRFSVSRESPLDAAAAAAAATTLTAAAAAAASNDASFRTTHSHYGGGGGGGGGGSYGGGGMGGDERISLGLSSGLPPSLGSLPLPPLAGYVAGRVCGSTPLSRATTPLAHLHVSQLTDIGADSASDFSRGASALSHGGAAAALGTLGPIDLSASLPDVRVGGPLLSPWLSPAGAAAGGARGSAPPPDDATTCVLRSSFTMPDVGVDTR